LTGHGSQVTNPENGLSFPRTDVGAAVESIKPATCGNAIIENGEDCDDGNVIGGDCCTASCLFEPVGSDCDDRDACSANDTCDGEGACLSGSPLACDDGLFCNGVETCDSNLGCQSGTAPAIDDGISCTEDSCDEASDSIINLANDLSCDDGDPCTANSCDEFLGCTSVPIEPCGVEPVPAVRSNGRVLLGLLMLAVAGVLLGSRRRARVSRTER
jgi:cysteine-rich repeat protein